MLTEATTGMPQSQTLTSNKNCHKQFHTGCGNYVKRVEDVFSKVRGRDSQDSAILSSDLVFEWFRTHSARRRKQLNDHMTTQQAAADLLRILSVNKHGACAMIMDFEQSPASFLQMGILRQER